MKGLANSVVALCIGIGFLVLTACSGLEDGTPTDSPTAGGRVEPPATGVAAAQQDTEQPTATPSPLLKPLATAEPATSSGGENAFLQLLSFVPSGYADIHLPVSFGPAIYLLDLDQIRADLGIGPISGASDYKEKLDLLIALGEASQGLPIYPETVFPVSSGAFDEWGWDFADVNSTLHLPDLGATVLSGNFGRPEVIQRLEQKGEKWPDPDISDFSIYEIRDGTAVVALRPDTLIVVKDEISAEPTYDKNDVIATLIVTDFESGGINEHPVVDELLTKLSDSWGVVLTASPDLEGFFVQNEQYWSSAEFPSSVSAVFSEFSSYNPASLPWDMMAIGFRNSDEETELILVYHYPDGDISSREMDIARAGLSESSSLAWRGLQLQDILHLKDMQVKDKLFVVNATTQHKAFLGRSLEERDYPVHFGLLLARED